MLRRTICVLSLVRATAFQPRSFAPSSSALRFNHSIRMSSTVDTSADVAEITSITEALLNSDAATFAAFPHYTADMMLIRPSGNPIDQEGFKAMMSGDVVLEGHESRGLKKIEVAGDMAFGVAVEYAKFSYKGTPNEDVSVWTLVYRKEGGSWKICHVHRSTGRKPNEPQPEF